MKRSALLLPRHIRAYITRFKIKSAAYYPVPGIISPKIFEIYSILAIGDEKLFTFKIFLMDFSKVSLHLSFSI